MNEEHLRSCSSPEWAEVMRRWIIPWVVDGIDLGNDVLEIGPGPGLSTNVVQSMVPRLTAVEVDSALAESLAKRYSGTNVTVICADAAQIPLDHDRFSAVICVSMLHHVPSPQHQDAILAEAYRLLRPGGVFLGEDSLDTPDLKALHEGDTYVPIIPDGFAARLQAVGFEAVDVDTNDYSVRFRGWKSARDVHPVLGQRLGHSETRQ